MSLLFLAFSISLLLVEYKIVFLHIGFHRTRLHMLRQIFHRLLKTLTRKQFPQEKNNLFLERIHHIFEGNWLSCSVDMLVVRSDYICIRLGVRSHLVDKFLFDFLNYQNIFLCVINAFPYFIPMKLILKKSYSHLILLYRTDIGKTNYYSFHF